MSRVRIKFCGMTRLEDARAAADLGADAVGLVFYAPSPRHVSIEQARIITQSLPPFVTTVGLFVDMPAEQITEIIRVSGVNCAQLHGNEPPQAVGRLGAIPVIKALHVHGVQLQQTLEHWRQAIARLPLTNLRGLLLETAGPLHGGSGIENDWEVLSQARAAGWFNQLPPVIVAGGLSPANVSGVIHRVKPWAVDVSSGVETSPGIKSPSKMAAFAQAVALSQSS